MKIELLPYAYFRGEIVPAEQATISIATHAVQYGTAAFGGIRGYLDASGESVNIFRLPDHTRRFMESAKILRADLAVNAEQAGDIIQELVRRNNPKQDIYIRPFVYKSAIELSPRLKDLEADLAIYLIPFGDYFEMSRPLRLMVSSWARTNDNTIPSRGKITGAYINSAFAKDQAEEAGYDDALMLNSSGEVSEGSGANFFLVRHGHLVTAPITSDILEGITRRTVLEFARDLGIPIDEREIDRSELYVADEAFLCGTGAQIAAVGVIDGRPVGDGGWGPVTKRLQEVFFATVRGENHRYCQYLTRVPVAD